MSLCTCPFNNSSNTWREPEFSPGVQEAKSSSGLFGEVQGFFSSCTKFSETCRGKRAIKQKKQCIPVKLDMQTPNFEVPA